MATLQPSSDDWWPRFDYDSVPLQQASSEIRVAYIHPSDQDVSASGSPVLELVVINIDDAEHMSYDALSYTWGRPADTLPYEWDSKDYTYPIYVNGYRFDVRPNLFYALQEIQARSLKSEQRDVLWIDAVCINQNNTEEKNVQVGRMHHIYSRCNRVLIWLGPDEGITKTTCDTITNISNNYDKQMRTAQARSENTFAGDSSLYMNTLGEPLDQFLRTRDSDSGRLDLESILTPIQALMKRSWWDRAWVWQELCRAPMAVFWIGPFEIGWEILTDVYHAWSTDIRTIDLLEHRPQYIRTSLDKFFDDCAVFLQLSNLESRWRESSPPQDPPDLVPALRYLRQTKASNPKDKAYAALGLCRIEDRIAVDYNLTVENVFASVVAKHIENHNDLTICNDCRYPPRISTLPSWSPDWTDDHFARRSKIDPNTFTWPGEARYCRYRAGGPETSSRHIQLSPDFRKLCVLGYSLDKVEFVADVKRIANWKVIPTKDALDLRPYAFSEDFRDLLLTKYASWFRQWAVCNSTGGFHSSPTCNHRVLHIRRRHYKRRIVFKKKWHYRKPRDATQFNELLYWPTEETVLHAYIRTLAADAVVGKPLGSYIHRMMDFPSGSGNAEFDFDLHGKTFAASHAHAFLLVPEECLPGDEILFVKGEEFPYIVRAKQQGYVMIGDCYMHGFMDGEALPIIEQQGGWRSIELI